MWAWFMTPLGAPPLGLAHALGLSATIGLFSPQDNSEKDSEDGPVVVVLTALLTPVVVVGFGWIFKSFMG